MSHTFLMNLIVVFIGNESIGFLYEKLNHVNLYAIKVINMFNTYLPPPLPPSRFHSPRAPVLNRFSLLLAHFVFDTEY